MPMERNHLKSYTPVAERLEKLGKVSLQFPFSVENCQPNPVTFCFGMMDAKWLFLSKITPQVGLLLRDGSSS